MTAPSRSARHAIVISALITLLARPCAAFPPDPNPHASALMREQKYEEAAAQLESYLATNRYDGRAWSNLGVCMYWMKNYDRARAASLQAIKMGFNPDAEMYNTACCYALESKKEDAIAWLTRALDSGFPDQETMTNDHDLDILRDDPRFVALTGLNAPDLADPDARWAFDLDFLIRRMEQMHWDLYANVSQEDFRAAVEALKKEAPRLDLQRAKSRLAKIVSMVGDGHTMVAGLAEGEDTVPRIPIQCNLFTDGVFVIGAPPRLRDLVGAQVMQIGSLDPKEAQKRIRPYCAADNEMTPLIDFPIRLTNPALLREIGALEGEGTEVPYTLRFPDGTTRVVALTPEPVGPRGFAGAYPDAVRGSDIAASPKPLYLENPDTPLWIRHLDSPNAVYFNFRGVVDNPDRAFADIVGDMFKMIEDTRAESLIIDMRQNTGGNTGLVTPLIHGLIRNDRVNKPGHLFVIIGRRTFSAAQNTVNMIEIHTNATFVGEPTGSRPNFVGESTSFVLPYSKLRVFCSSRYWQFLTSTDERVWVQPQIAAELSSRDYFENRDPCMEAILARLSVPPAQTRTSPPRSPAAHPEFHGNN